MTAYKPLCDAIRAGDASKLRRLAKTERAAARHWKPIMDAAFAGRADMVEILIEAGADPNVIASTPGRHTPVIRIMQHHATIPRHEGHQAAARTLLDAGADPNLCGGPHHFEPLAYAAMGGARHFIDLLMAHGATRTIHLSAALYDRPALRSFLKRAGSANSHDARRRTPLHYVALSGMWRSHEAGSTPALECAEALIDAGVEIDAPEWLGESEAGFRATALWRAVGWQQHAALARRLLAAGADPNPAVFAAAFEGNTELLELLHEHGADWNLEHDGRTPLIDLMYYKRPAMAAWLLAHGADPNRRDARKRTALHWAAIQGVKDSHAAALLAGGVKRHLKDTDGKTALDYAREHRRAGIATLLGKA